MGKGLKVSTRRTQAHYGPVVSTRSAIARGSRSVGTPNPQPQKRSRRHPKKKVEHAADKNVADEVLTPDWEARGARAGQGRGPSLSRDAEVDHLDVQDVQDVQAVVPYLTEIHQHYRETEGLKDARYGYMSKQTDINAKMRSILFDWLVEVHLKFKLVPETLFMTFGLVDRYLEKEQIMRSRLQLVGCAAMFISSKYEDIFAPECCMRSKAWPLCLPTCARPVLGCGEGSTVTAHRQRAPEPYWAACDAIGPDLASASATSVEQGSTWGSGRAVSPGDGR
tara:strand:- start:236 stop:1075 length:840 start_codon:yes stop_codon:yes gene_type:complete